MPHRAAALAALRNQGTDYRLCFRYRQPHLPRESRESPPKPSQVPLERIRSDDSATNPLC